MKTRSGFCLLVFASLISATRAAVHFKYWYRQYRHVFESIMEEHCQAAYRGYLTEVAPKDYLSGTITPVIDCILGNLNETRKSNMAAASVLLGLLPTTLGLAGSTTMEVGLVALRRPFLALLLAAGAPAVSPIRTFDYVDPKELLQKKPGSVKVFSMGPTKKPAIALLQYVIAAAAVVNLATASYELCIRTVCSFAPENAYEPALWAFLAVAVHLFGSLSVYLRVRIVTGGSGANTSGRERLWQRIRREFIPSAAREEAELEIKDETYLYILLAWFTSMGTVLHIIYGTLVFSSILFISTGDAVIVVVRYLSSTLVCRAMVMFELSGLRQALDRQKGDSQSGHEFMPMGEIHGDLPLSYRECRPRKEVASSHVEELRSSLLRE
jgi:hypothetical protein